MHFDCISEASNDFSRAEVFRYFLKKVCFEKVIFISDEEQSPRKDLYFLRVHAILMLPVTLNCIQLISYLFIIIFEIALCY